MVIGVGAQVGPYEIVVPLGAGGMGEVYRARDSRLGRDVAIKILPPDFANNTDRLRRFEQEARAAAALNHPNILAVFDIGTHNGAPYLVSELLEGETLRAYLARESDAALDRASHAQERGRSPSAPAIRKAVDVAAQIARGLAAAHDKGIVHRDLKPENLFLTNDGRIKILDFGLAKLTQLDSVVVDASLLPTRPAETAPGVVLGTVGYMAPEQVRGLATDYRSDIFAFGAVLYEMVSGRRAFDGETSAETMTAILREEPPELTRVHPDVPPALERIVGRCLDKNPSARFQSTSDLAFALEALSASPQTGGSSISTVDVAPVSPRKARERLLWGLVAILTAVVAGLAVPATRHLSESLSNRLVVRFGIQTPVMGDPLSFALSQDGRQLAFVASDQGAQRLWVRTLDQVTTRPLQGTEGASYPFWAPDGIALGFFADGKLKRIDVAGGAPQVLANAPSGRGGTWSADDVIVFAPTAQGGGLMRIAATGGTPTAATELGPGHGSHRWPQFLPDGRRFLFFVGFGQPDTRGMYMASLEGSDSRKVLEAESAAVFAPPDLLLEVRQGVLFAQRFDLVRGMVSGAPMSVAQAVGLDAGVARGAFAVSANGVLAHREAGRERRQLVWVDRTGTTMGIVGAPDENGLTNPELAPDGQRVAVHRTVEGAADVWLIEIVRGVPSRFTFSRGVSPLWHPDGRRVVFRAISRNGIFDLFEKPASDAGDESPLLETAENKVALSWSPDGRVLLYATENAQTGADLLAVEFDRSTSGSFRATAGGGTQGRPLNGRAGEPFPVVQTAFDEAEGQFSPNGQWVAYQSNASGRTEIYLRPFPVPGATIQISTAGGGQPRWRPDGRELFYVAPDAKLMAVPLLMKADRPTLEPGAPMPLFTTRLATGANVSVGGLSKQQYSIAPDGRFLMNVAVEETTAQSITVALNWEAGINK
jgi:eukaryotic-like serine/threonine-protein kinase